MIDHAQWRRVRQSTMNRCAANIALVVSMTYSTSALGVPLDQIPSPRPAGWTVDLTSRVSSDTFKALDSLGNEVHKQTGAELAIVVIGSTEGANPHQFATDLFNRWHIGQANKNNGVLMFAALDDRKAEIILGDGVNDDARVQASREIMQGIVLPRFKAGDPGGAVFHGARACAEKILGAKLEPLQAEAAGPLDAKPAEVAPVPVNVQPAQPMPQPAVARPAFAPPQQRPHSGILGWLFGGLGVTGVTTFGARKYLRYHSRRCPGCRGDMTRLGEAADDEHLTQGERTEEQVGSVDYDVWACGTC